MLVFQIAIGTLLCCKLTTFKHKIANICNKFSFNSGSKTNILLKLQQNVVLYHNS